MVTGAGGSIGSELCRQVARFHPARLLLLDQSEVQLFPIEQELIRSGFGGLIQPLIADILDQAHARLLREHRPRSSSTPPPTSMSPMMERSPAKRSRTTPRDRGARRVALEHGVERFVMISTDKAVNPTSVMGASKRLAEVFIQACAERHPGKTRFLGPLRKCARLLRQRRPIFEQQIARGGPVTVTDPDVVRYFMTIPEAVGLVFKAPRSAPAAKSSCWTWASRSRSPTLPADDPPLRLRTRPRHRDQIRRPEARRKTV